MYYVGGTRNVAKAVKKIAQGAAMGGYQVVQRAVRQMCELWFVCFILLHMLCALGKSTKTHLYWCMKKCGDDAEQLRSDILNIVQHYIPSKLCELNF